MSVDRSLFRELFVAPLRAQRRVVVVGLTALSVLAAAQGLFLLLVKGFVKALFEQTEREFVPLTELLPPKVLSLAPAFAEATVPRADLAIIVPICVLVAGLLKAGATYHYQLSQQALALYVAKHYRERLFTALLSLPYVEIRRRPPGEWMSLIMNDVMFLQARFSDLTTALVKDTVIIAASFAFLTVLHWPTALVLALLSPIVAFGMGRTGKRIAYFTEAFQRELARIAAAVLDLRARFDFIRAQGGERYELRRFKELTSAYYRMIRKSILVRSAFAPSLEFLGFALFAFFIYAIGRGLWGKFTPDLMLQFLVALGLLLRPLREVGEQLSRLEETRGSLRSSLQTFRRLGELAQAPGSAEAATSRSASSTDGSLDLHIEKLSAGLGDKAALRAQELEVAPGRAVAIVGPSGAGKSTLIKTLAGLVEPSEWQASLAWRDVARNASMVSQEPFLFDDTVAANLTYGLTADERSSEASLWQALAFVNMDEEIRAFPGGLGARLRTLGANLSGGQLQRLVIARGLLRKKRLWLLDEATSAIDVKSEREITLRLIERCHEEGLALLWVTHRLTWLDSFDEVWFVEDGELRFRGPHQELLKTPRYQEFCQAESGGDAP